MKTKIYIYKDSDGDIAVNFEKISTPVIHLFSFKYAEEWITNLIQNWPEVTFEFNFGKMPEFGRGVHLQPLLLLANKAKNAGDFELANVAFAAILSSPPADTRFFVETDRFENLEFQDSELYYDLAIIKNGQNQQINIPLPLLNINAMLFFLYKALRTDKQIHSRIVYPANTENLWDDFAKIVPIAEYQAAINLLNIPAEDLWNDHFAQKNLDAIKHPYAKILASSLSAHD